MPADRVDREDSRLPVGAGHRAPRALSGVVDNITYVATMGPITFWQLTGHGLVVAAVTVAVRAGCPAAAVLRTSPEVC